MAISNVLFSSAKDYWETPQKLFDSLNEEFNFTIDVAANETNHKLPRYFTKETDALAQDWGGEIAFCNPPYGRNILLWVKKCKEEAEKPNTLVVMLIPARTDTRWFHEYIWNKANVEIRFLRGRLKFELQGETLDSAPFPSMIVIFK